MGPATTGLQAEKKNQQEIEIEIAKTETQSFDVETLNGKTMESHKLRTESLYESYKNSKATTLS